jgi:hypothetical protein
MMLTFTSTGYGVSFAIQKPSDADWKFEVLGWPFSLGDQLFFSSEENNKYIYVTRRGITTAYTTNLMGYITANSQWPIIFPGTNTFNVFVSGAQFTYNFLDYYETFWGL